MTVDDVAVDATRTPPSRTTAMPKRMLTIDLPVSDLRALGPSTGRSGTANVDVTGYWGLVDVPRDVARRRSRSRSCTGAADQLGGKTDGGLRPDRTVVWRRR